MLVRIHLHRSHGPRGPGAYLVDADEARDLVAAGVADAITPVTPQTGLTDGAVVAATGELVAELLPPALPDPLPGEGEGEATTDEGAPTP